MTELLSVLLVLVFSATQKFSAFSTFSAWVLILVINPINRKKEFIYLTIYLYHYSIRVSFKSDIWRKIWKFFHRQALKHWKSLNLSVFRAYFFESIAILSRKSPFGTEGTENHWPVSFQNFRSTSTNFQCQHWDLGALNFSARGTEALKHLSTSAFPTLVQTQPNPKPYLTLKP